MPASLNPAGTHFIRRTTATGFACARDEERIADEAGRKKQGATKSTGGKLPSRNYIDLLDLATQAITFSGQAIDKLIPPHPSSGAPSSHYAPTPLTLQQQQQTRHPTLTHISAGQSPGSDYKIT